MPTIIDMIQLIPFGKHNGIYVNNGKVKEDVTVPLQKDKIA